MSDWPHAPVHRLAESGAFIVTAGTYQKLHHFSSPERLALVQDQLFDLADTYHWQLQAWAILSNHYHLVALSPEDPSSLRGLIQKLHSLTAREINRLDQSPGRKIWFQYWDTAITFERSFLARLNYVHRNPVHHARVTDATQYPWCSAKWFEAKADPAFYKQVSGAMVDQVKVQDDF